ncbi:MAG: hypothetical protein KH110_10360 [Clostridiales bacterium]|nr:hypothetical protein [Clostridiales bacterium]
MLENMIRGVMERKIGEEYPQAQLPPVMLAQVSAVSESGNIKEEHRQVQVELEDGPRTVETVIRKKGYVYSLRIIGRDGEPDSRYPVIPGVRSLIQADPGDTVAVAMLYGALDPYIIGEVI